MLLSTLKINNMKTTRIGPGIYNMMRRNYYTGPKLDIAVEKKLFLSSLVHTNAADFPKITTIKPVLLFQGSLTDEKLIDFLKKNKNIRNHLHAIKEITNMVWLLRKHNIFLNYFITENMSIINIYKHGLPFLSIQNPFIITDNCINVDADCITTKLLFASQKL